MFRRPLIWILCFWILGETVAFMLGCSLYSKTSFDEAMSESSLSVTVEGTIENIDINEAYVRGSLFSCDVFVGDSKGEKLKTNGLLVYDDRLLEIEGGARIRMSGRAETFDTPDNPGEFNKWQYYRTRGIDYLFYPDEIEVLEEGNGVLRLLDRVSRRLSESIENICADENEAGIFKAMFLGDSAGLPEDVQNDFSVCGISHILAISGLHLSLIGMAIFRLLKKCHIHPIVASIVADATLLFYVLLTGGRVSAWRAFIMFTLTLAAPYFRRSYDLLSALGLAGILILISQPLYALDASFRLSFAALFGIGIIAPRLMQLTEGNYFKAHEGAKKIASAFIISLSVQMMTLPVMAFHYYTISIYGVFLNLIVIPLMSVALSSVILGAVFGSLFMLFGIFTTLFGTFFIGAAHYIFVALTKVCGVVADFPYAQIVVGKPSALQVGIYYALLLGILFLFFDLPKFSSKFHPSLSPRPAHSPLPAHSSHKAGLCRFAFAILLLALPLILHHARGGATQITTLYVGQGDCTVVELESGHAIIFDCGSSDKKKVAKNIILPFLKSEGIDEIDMIFLSHPDDDHINATIGILEDKSIETSGISIPKATAGEDTWNEIRNAADSNAVKIHYLKKGDNISFASDEKTTIVSPDADEKFDNDNDSSMVVCFESGNFSALFTGDISEKQEKKIVNSYSLNQKATDITSRKDGFQLNSIEYLKCAHHGSKSSTSSEFLEAIHPKIATLSAGRKNRYGHPAAETIARLTNKKIKYFCTKNCGAIITTINSDGTMVVKKYKSNKQK